MPLSVLPFESGRMCSPATGIWLATGRLADRPDHATRSSAVRLLLDWLLAAVAPDAAGAVVSSTATGAPVLPEHLGLGVSLAHDGPWLAAAVATGRAVGVDVQVPIPGSAKRLARRCLGRHADQLAGWPASRCDEELAWVWTVQESCVKLAGAGLAARPWTLDVPPSRCAGRIGTVAWHSLRGWSDIPLSCAYRTGGVTGAEPVEQHQPM